MLKRSFFHTYAPTFAPLINCVIADALLETMQDIDQGLLQFIDVMNLLDSPLHFSPCFCSQPGSDVCCLVAKCLVK